MNMRRMTQCLLGAAIFFAAGAAAGEVKTDYDRNTDFHQFHTYSWETVRTADQLWIDRIKSAVDSALASKGWTRVDSGGDVAVMAVEMTRDQQTLNTFYDDFGGGWRWGGGFGASTTDVDSYKVGTLVVDLFNAKDKNLVWRGSASDTLSSKSSSNIRALDRGVQKMFEHFPPEPKK